MRVCFLLFFMLFACQNTSKTPAQETPSSVSLPEGTDWPTPLRIGIATHLNEKTSLSDFDAFDAYLEKHLKIDCQFVLTKSYEELAEKIVAHEVDIGSISPFNYVKIKQEDEDVTLLAQHIATGASSYGSYIITLAKTEIRTLPDLRGKTLALVDLRSTSGYLFPMGGLLDAGLFPETDLKHIAYLGSHHKVIRAVLAGDFDAGAVWSGAIQGAKKKGLPTENLRVIYKSRRIPNDAYAARSGLPDSLLQALKNTLFSLSSNTEEGRKALFSLPSQINGFVPTSDQEYDLIREEQKKVETILKQAPKNTD